MSNNMLLDEETMNEFIATIKESPIQLVLKVAKSEKTPTQVLEWIVENNKDSLVVKSAKENLALRLPAKDPKKDVSDVSGTPVKKEEKKYIQGEPKISYKEAVAKAYSKEINDVIEALMNNLSVRINTDKAIYSYVLSVIRDRLKGAKTCKLITEEPKKAAANAGILDGLGQQSITTRILNNLKDALAKRIEERSTARDSKQIYNEPVFLFNHYDFLQSTTLTEPMKEIIAAFTSDPTVVICGVYDRSVSENSGSLQPIVHLTVGMYGISKEGLQDILTKEEKEKFGSTEMFKYVSTMNPFQFRKVMDSMKETSTIDEIKKYSNVGNVEFPNVKMEDIGGYDSIKKLIKDKVIRFAGTKLFPKGIILTGNPGNGKSFLAKMIATELEASIQIIGASELKNSLFGETESAIRKVFAEARKNAPAVIVFDEFDAIAGQRGNGVNSNITNSIVNELLTQLDGFKSQSDVLVVATTNFIENIDSAMLRPGRFTFKVNIPDPTKEDRKAVINVWNRKQKLLLTEDTIDYFVERTEHSEKRLFSCDVIKGYCDEIERHRVLNDFPDNREFNSEDLFTVFEESSI